MRTYLALTRADVADYVETLAIVYLVLIFIRILISWIPRMPYNRFKDQLAADGKTVVRTADQLRADLVAYLLSFKDAAFDAIEMGDQAKWKPLHKEVLNRDHVRTRDG